MDDIENYLKRLSRRVDEIENRPGSEIGKLLGNEFRNFSKRLLDFGSLGRRTDEFINSESTVDSSLPTPQRQEEECDISPTIIPSSPKSREVTSALHDEVRSRKTTGGVKVENIQNSEEVFKAVEGNPLLDIEALNTYDMHGWWASDEGHIEVPILYS
jgi:hypothetical protein